MATGWPWVGTFDDIVKGREGRSVRLMDNTKDADCAPIPASRSLPAGTFVLTTYGHWTAEEPPYIMSVRLKLDELDRLAR